MSVIEIKVPNIGDFKDVEVIEVLVSEGQTLKKNDPLITIESDKSSVEIPSSFDGKIKTLKTKKADDVSLTTLIMFIIGVLSWIIYGYKISSTPILIANLITLILNLLILIFKIYFSKN